MPDMKRREFISLLGGAATVPALLWPGAAQAQPGGRTRRIGVLIHFSENQPVGQRYIAAFRQGLTEAPPPKSSRPKFQARPSIDLDRPAIEVEALDRSLLDRSRSRRSRPTTAGTRRPPRLDPFPICDYG